MTPEEQKQKSAAILEKINTNLHSYVESQLAKKCSFEDLRVLMKVLDCSLPDLADRVLAAKQGRSR